MVMGCNTCRHVHDEREACAVLYDPDCPYQSEHRGGRCRLCGGEAFEEDENA
jgi:hypothetical protein